MIRIQRRVLIDVEAFEDWLESDRAGAALSLHSEMKNGLQIGTRRLTP
jgi:hypothetical protein